MRANLLKTLLAIRPNWNCLSTFYFLPHNTIIPLQVLIILHTHTHTNAGISQHFGYMEGRKDRGRKGANYFLTSPVSIWYSHTKQLLNSSLPQPEVVKEVVMELARASFTNEMLPDERVRGKKFHGGKKYCDLGLVRRAIFTLHGERHNVILIGG